jgi:hypothetical protein
VIHPGSEGPVGKLYVPFGKHGGDPGCVLHCGSFGPVGVCSGNGAPSVACAVTDAAAAPTLRTTIPRALANAVRT